MPYGYGGPSGPPGGGATSQGSGRDYSPPPSRPTPSPHRDPIPVAPIAVAPTTRSRIQEEREEDFRNQQIRDDIIQRQQEKDYIDIISKTTAPGTGTTSELQGQLKLDEYQEPNTLVDKAVGFGLNMILPGAGYLYGLESNPYKASNFFAGTGVQDLDREALLSGYLSPEDAAAYQAGTYGRPTTTGGTTGTSGGEGPVIGGGPDVMPITSAKTPPVLPTGGINTLPVDSNLTAGYTDQQDFLDNIYRENLLDFFKGTGYTGLYG